MSHGVYSFARKVLQLLSVITIIVCEESLVNCDKRQPGLMRRTESPRVPEYNISKEQKRVSPRISLKWHNLHVGVTCVTATGDRNNRRKHF